MPSVQEQPGKRHQLPGPAAMLAELSRVTAKGYKITSVTELQFEGSVPPIMSVDARTEDPNERRVLPILMPHGDHWHLYIYTLAKPEVLAPDRPHPLTEQTLTALASLSMDERATVPVRGHA